MTDRLTNLLFICPYASLAGPQLSDVPFLSSRRYSRLNKLVSVVELENSSHLLYWVLVLEEI